jgi:SAM-dependent methyltransferase
MDKTRIMSSTCPVCASIEFAPTSQRFELAEILSRWQSAIGIVFDDFVWSHYTRSDMAQVTLHRCFHCGFAMFEPPVTGTPEFYTAITEKDYYVAEKWEFFEALKDLGRLQSQQILDVGCGSGDFLALLKSRGIDGWGYEFSLEVAQVASTRGHKVFSGEFPETLTSESPKKFDAICMFQVLEHVADPIKLLENARDLLRAGGILIVSVPDASGPIRHFSDSLTEIPPHHVSRWSESAFCFAAPRLGFSMEKVAYEPLPAILWDAYLPVLWDDNIWPAQLCRSVDPDHKMDQVQQIAWFTDQMKKQGVKWLEGVPGHTLYVVLRLAYGDPLTRPASDAADRYPADPVTEKFAAETRRTMEDWVRIQTLEYKRRIERREAGLSLREAELSQREAALDQREAQYNAHPLVAFYRWVRKIMGDI